MQLALRDHQSSETMDELRALKAVQVQRVWLEIRRRDEHDAALEQHLDEPPHEHRVGDVGDVEFIEAQEPRRAGEIARDRRRWIGFALKTVQLVMDALHETMKVDALFALDRRVGEEAVHEKAFSAADAAPQVEPAHLAPPDHHAQER